jgi:hypothetical protein
MGNYLSKDIYVLDPDRKQDFISDLTISIAFSVILGFHTYLTIQSFKSIEMRNIYNYLMTISIFTCLVTHIICLQYSIWHDQNGDFYRNSLQNYIYFQLTFDLLNISLLS